ncbi:MAG: hypothetical protein JSU67_17100 [Gammaproteobacteria bacterium]|nr:MAG: hypothetical protein JSU67_17100 [Gammaproteobacteria bacterium]
MIEGACHVAAGKYFRIADAQRKSILVGAFPLFVIAMELTELPESNEYRFFPGIGALYLQEPEYV